MVDMSHYEKEENLSKTWELAKLCHAKGIAVEAESGRMNGSEDGIAGTGDLEEPLTTPADVEEFIQDDIDMLAPSVGNIHGDYGSGGPHIDMSRLRSIKEQLNPRIELVLHGTNHFEPDLMKDCVKAGVSKINIKQADSQMLA